MNVLMFTNTFTPHVGGVARSVSELARQLRQVGDRVLIVAPEFEGMPSHEDGVVRIPALQNFGGSDFSVPLPLSTNLSTIIEEFQPDIVHSHHPFLLGDSALRAASSMAAPIIFTYHTRYELYGHYVAQDSDLLKRLAQSLSIGYCDLCDGVIAPSESISHFLRAHSVKTKIATIPTGVDTDVFRNGVSTHARQKHSVPEKAPLVGHVGRLAPEKNLGFLAASLALVLNQNKEAYALIVGEGTSRSHMLEIFRSVDVDDRVRFTGVLQGTALVDAYASMDVFAFSSRSETQGLVLAEAMAASVPVVALDAPGAREMVRDGINGRLLSATAEETEFASAVASQLSWNMETRKEQRQAARRTAERFSISSTTDQVRSFYKRIESGHKPSEYKHDNLWASSKRAVSNELDIMANIAHAASDALFPSPTKSNEQK